MITATIYSAQGQVLGFYSASTPEALQANLNGKNWIAGRVPRHHYIDNGQAVPMPVNPDTETLKHRFDYETKSWTVDLKLTEQSIRTKRNDLLLDIDRINPVWFSSLTDEQKQVLQQYRQALLDVPQQQTFPHNVTWPSKPGWL